MESNTPKIDGMLQMLRVGDKVSSGDSRLEDELWYLARKTLSEPGRGLMDDALSDYLCELSMQNFNGLMGMLNQPAQ